MKTIRPFRLLLSLSFFLLWFKDTTMANNSHNDNIAPPDSSPIMRKMHLYNSLFDGIPKTTTNNEKIIMDATAKAIIDDLWHSDKLQIHRSEGVIQGYQDFFQSVSGYLQQGLKTEFLVLEPHPKGLRYVVKATLPNHQDPMILESIATVQDGKIVKIEPGKHSDIYKFLGK